MAQRSLTAPGRARSAIYLVSSNMVASVCTFALAIVLARALGPAGKGYFDIVVNSASLLTTFTGFSLASGIFFHVARNEVNHRRLLAWLLLGSAAIGLLVALALLRGSNLALARWLLPGGSSLQSAILIAALLAVTHLQQFSQAVARGYGLFGVSGIADVLTRGGLLAAALALALLNVQTPASYAIVATLVTLAAAVYLVACFWNVESPVTDVPWRAVTLYSLPLFLGNAVQFLNYRLDVFFVKNYLGLPAVGQYTVAVGLTQALWLIPNALAVLVLRSAATDQTATDSGAQVALVNRFCLAVSVLGAAALVGLASGTLTPVFGERFRESLSALVLLAPGTVLFAQTIILSAFLNGIRMQVYTTFVACGAVVATIALDILLIPRIGIEGAALASTISYTVSSGATLVLAHRELPGTPLTSFFVPQPSDWTRAVALARAGLTRARQLRTSA